MNTYQDPNHRPNAASPQAGPALSPLAQIPPEVAVDSGTFISSEAPPFNEGEAGFQAQMLLPKIYAREVPLDTQGSWANHLRSSFPQPEVSQWFTSLYGITPGFMPAREVIEAAVFVVDIVDSTHLLEEIERRNMSPSMVLDELFAPLIQAVRGSGGRFTGIIGDAMSAVFTRDNAAWDALNAALSLQERRSRDLAAGLPRPSMRIGLSFGKVELQPVAQDLQPRAIGSVVNRAFHCASGRSECEQIPNTETGFSIFIDSSIRERLNLPNLMTIRPESK